MKIRTPFEQKIYDAAYKAAYKAAYEKYTSIKGGAGSGNFGHAGRPGEVGGSSSGFNTDNKVNHAPGTGGTIVSKNRFTPEAGGYMYHGTRMPDGQEYLIADSDGVVYLTDDYLEASGYAEGGALSSDYGGTPRVVAVSLAAGKIVNVQSEIDSAIQNGDDFTDIFSSARSSGADYAFYTHPSFIDDREQQIIVALNPDATIGSTQRMFTWKK